VKNSLIALIIIAGGFFVTNPEKPTYVDYASVRFADTAKAAICRSPQLPDWAQSLGGSIQEICMGAVTTGTNFGREPLQNFINSTTERQNFLLFSIYKTEFPGRTIRTIGVLGNFFPLQ
jgi:hypothetical protein